MTDLTHIYDIVEDTLIQVIQEDYIVENSFERGEGRAITFKRNGEWKVLEFHISDNQPDLDAIKYQAELAMDQLVEATDFNPNAADKLRDIVDWYREISNSIQMGDN